MPNFSCNREIQIKATPTCHFSLSRLSVMEMAGKTLTWWGGGGQD